MAVNHIKSTAIQNSDQAQIIVPNPTGNGSAGYKKEVGGSLVAVAADSINSTYRFCRVPSNCKVKQLRLTNQAQAVGAMDVGVYYPTSGPTGLPDLAANAISQALFASAVDLSAALANTDITNESGSYTGDKWLQPLWQAAGLTSDPGGYFDIVGTLTTAVTTGTGIIGLSVEFVE